MIVRPRPSALRLFFVMRGSIVPHIAGKLAVVAAVSMLAVWLQGRGARLDAAHLAAVPFSLLGLALSVFLGFRNNVCYDRWWEARQQWGLLIAASRALAREVLAALPAPPGQSGQAGAAGPQAQVVVRRCIGFAHALAARLRDEDAAAAAGPWLSPQERAALAAAANANNLIAGLIAQDLAAARRAGLLGDIVYQGLLAHLHACTVVQAACERLKGTPTPFAYSLLLHRTAWFFCLLLPFGLAGTLGAVTPLVVVIVAYTFFGLDALGDELEEPFGRADNDLPLDALVRGLEIDLLEALGVQPLPQALQARGYVLS